MVWLECASRPTLSSAEPRPSTEMDYQVCAPPDLISPRCAPFLGRLNA